MLAVKEYVDSVPSEVIKFCEANLVREPLAIKEAKIFLVLYKDTDILGVLVYGFMKFGDGEELPRLLHIIFDKKIRNTKKTVMFLLNGEKIIANKGYNRLIAYTRKSDKDILELEKKFRFEIFNENETHYYLVKGI